MTGKTAGIIIVGDEILKGQVRDINSYFMCKRLRAIGTEVKKISVVTDIIADIANTVKEFSQRYDIVLTSGGIGPTHDDVTYKGVALGFDEDVICNETLEAFWNNYTNTESSRAMSLIPKSASIIWADPGIVLVKKNGELEVRTFPLVRVCNVFVFPGIPEYLHPLFLALEKNEYFRSPGCSFYTGRIYLSVDEDLILNILNQTVKEFKDCVFGSYPVIGNPSYKTKITVEAASVNKVKAAEDYFKALVPPEFLACDRKMYNPVYKFLQTTADPELALTLKNSIQVIEHSFNEYSAGGLMISLNGGKDCTVLLHIALAVKESLNIAEPLQAVYFQPSNPFSEVESFIQDTVSRYQLELTTLPGPIKSALGVLLEQKPNTKAIFLGTRRTDPFSQNLQPLQMTDVGWPSVMRISPILDWSYHNIWTFLQGIAAPYCSLYDQGYTSLGNVDNTKPNPSLLYTDSEGRERYQPAWMLIEDSAERNGRVSSSKVSGASSTGK